MPAAVIESLDHEGKGIARVDGKAIFIEGALPGEWVEFSSYRKKPKFEQATVTRLVTQSSQRVQPGCPHFDVCGGCSMQHLEPMAQVAVKQRVLENALWHIARIKAETVFSPIYGAPWAYRERARLAVCYEHAQSKARLGFHEKKSSFIAEINECRVLPEAVSGALVALRQLIQQLSVSERVLHVDVAVSEDKTVLVLRHLQALSGSDIAALKSFGKKHGFSMWLQPGGLETVHPVEMDEEPYLSYTLPEFGLRLRYRPVDFTQVNVLMNRLLIRRAMQLLDPLPGEHIADLFCGLGNFSLPIAARGASVVGVEGLLSLTQRASENAVLNQLSERCVFQTSDLFAASPASLAKLGRFDKMLIDPPREGAIAVCRALGQDAPRRIVYVSCNPATLARDAAVLVQEKGYRLRGAGIANMFPQTSHVESIALFERD